EAVAALMESTLADHEIAGVTRSRTGSVLPGVAPSNVYPCADGSEVIIAANADTVFRRLCAAMGTPALADDQRFAEHHARGVNMVELDGIIGAWTARFDGTALLEHLAANGIPAGRIYTAPDMLTDPQYLAREMVLRTRTPEGWDLPMTGIVPKFTATPGRVRFTGPTLGEHTRAVLAEIGGFSAAEVDSLYAAGTVA
ncbi:MAG TPA: CoA transferase, partial [Ilumatobacteraceae bacterium]|nr:CoA transferase [Ilumatobacteraceae bacterium]